jgi:hypothetical protein
VTDPKFTPPHELIEEWIEQFKGDHPIYVAIQAAQWGADQELEACCEWLDQKVLLQHQSDVVPALRAARRPRPKPPSLKEQALKELAWVDEHLDMPLHNHCNAIHTIRRALEALPE